MRKSIMILLSLALPLAAAAQQRMTFDQLQRKYSEQKDYTVIEIAGNLLKLGGNTDMEGVRDIRIITSEEQNPGFTKDIESLVTDRHEVLTSVKKRDQTALFYYIKPPESDKIWELMMILHGEETNMVMIVRGEFSIQQIRSIIDHSDDLEDLDDLDDLVFLP